MRPGRKNWVHSLLVPDSLSTDVGGGLADRFSVTQSCLTLCNPMNCSLPGSSVHGTFQARILEWVAISFFNPLTQFSSVAQPCLTLCDPMDGSRPGLPVHHQLPKLAQTHDYRVSDAIQPSHLLSSPFLPTFNLSQHQGLFK